MRWAGQSVWALSKKDAEVTIKYDAKERALNCSSFLMFASQLLYCKMHRRVQSIEGWLRECSFSVQRAVMWWFFTINAYWLRMISVFMHSNCWRHWSLPFNEWFFSRHSIDANLYYHQVISFIGILMADKGLAFDTIGYIILGIIGLVISSFLGVIQVSARNIFCSAYSNIAQLPLLRDWQLHRWAVWSRRFRCWVIFARYCGARDYLLYKQGRLPWERCPDLLCDACEK